MSRVEYSEWRDPLTIGAEAVASGIDASSLFDSQMEEVAPVDDVELQMGMRITVSDFSLRIGKRIGFGSYGSVWEATVLEDVPRANSKKGDVIAVKEIVVTPNFSYESAAYEVMIAKLLGSKSDRYPDVSVPMYLADHVADQTAKRNMTVRLCMQKIAGDPLDTWMYKIDTSMWRETSVRELTQDKWEVFPHNRNVGKKTTEEALGVASTMLRQLIPAFARLENDAFHRDVNAHNVLYVPAENIPNAPPQSTGQFYLIDFGMATDSNVWVQEQKWRSGSIGGDTRYWGPGSWALYLWGTACLDNDRKFGLLNQYSQRIDYFAFGILALELFFNLQQPSSDPDIERARSAFFQYWVLNIQIFQIVMKHYQGLLAEARGPLQSKNVFHVYMKELTALSDSLIPLRAHPVVGPFIQVVQVTLNCRSDIKWHQYAYHLFLLKIIITSKSNAIN